MTLEARYMKAINEIGGAAALLNLPEDVKTALKATTDLKTKVELLEGIAWYTLTPAELEAHKEECGAKSAMGLLLLCPPDRFAGDYDRAMADITIAIYEAETLAIVDADNLTIDLPEETITFDSFAEMMDGIEYSLEQIEEA